MGDGGRMYVWDMVLSGLFLYADNREQKLPFRTSSKTLAKKMVRKLVLKWDHRSDLEYFM